MPAAVIHDVLAPGAVEAIEAAAVRHDPRRESLRLAMAPGGWARPIEGAIFQHLYRLLAPFPAKWGLLNRRMLVGGLAVHRANPRLPGGRWHTDGAGSSALRVNWYGGDFEGGAFELEDGSYPVRRNSLLAFDAAARHRVQPVTRGLRLAVLCNLVGHVGMTRPIGASKDRNGGDRHD